MKPKKSLLPTIAIVVAILAIVACSIIIGIAKKPTVTEGEFPFSITYELNGETVTINDVYRARYIGNDGYLDTKDRMYVGEIGNRGEGNTSYIIKVGENTRVKLYTNFYPDYLMGDFEDDYFEDEAFEPQIFYYDADETEYSDEETLSAQGVKLISFDYPTPIENSLVFSHISYFSNEVVIPTVLIALLALVVILVFVRKEKELKRKETDNVSLVFNFVVGFALVPFTSIAAMLIDINGGGPELYRQVLYFIPSFLVLSIAASVALRRKDHAVKSLVVAIIGPAVFAVYLIICAVCGLL